MCVGAGREVATVAADSSVVALVPEGDAQAPHDRVTIVTNFFEELRRTVPAAGPPPGP